MERRRPRLEQPRYVSTTMSADRTLKQRWINGFKLAFFASVLFGLVALPFEVVANFLPEPKDRSGGCAGVALIWLAYFLVMLLLYPIVFDWCASVFRIQFVHKSIRIPAKPPSPASPPAQGGE